MEQTIFQISLDTDLAYKLRDTINSEQEISTKKRQTLRINKKEKEYPAWSLMCAIMDRIDDTVDYLNQLKLNTGKYPKSAFDFFDFMNQSSVMIDCIEIMAKIYEVSFDNENQSTEIFGEKGDNGKGTDKKYFDYLRSLCSVHPVETSYYDKMYQKDDFECCPYVVWNTGRIWDKKDCNLHAQVYVNGEKEGDRHIGINIVNIFDYVKYRYSLLEKVICGIKKYNQDIIQGFISSPLKFEADFDCYTDYLEYLRVEGEERLGKDCVYELEFVSSLFKLALSNSENQSHFEKYRNAIRYAVGFQHSAIQNRNLKGFCNDGILQPRGETELTLLDQLCHIESISPIAKQYHYQFKKISYLAGDSSDGNKRFAYAMLEEVKSLLENYVSFDGAQSDYEYYALVKVALYFDCLENKCPVNKNSPNNLAYRDRFLSREEIEELNKEEVKVYTEGVIIIDDIPNDE